MTDGETRAALALTRSLGRGGHSVVVAAAEPRSLAGSSRYCAAREPQAAGERGARAVAGSLRRALRMWRPDRVVGVTDRTLSVLHAMGGVPLVPPSPGHYARASDKVELWRDCRRLGITTPRGIAVEAGTRPARVDLDGLGTPLVLKPALSWRLVGDSWTHGEVSLEPDAAGVLDRAAADPACRFPYLVQERIEGAACGLFVFAVDGAIRVAFSHRRLREKPPGGGVSTVCESVAPPADLLRAAQRYCRDRSYSGVAMFEFKRVGADGAPHLLEINARPWGSLALAVAAGVDFPGWMVGGGGGPGSVDGADPSPSYHEGVRLRWWWGDVDHFYLVERARGRGRAASLVRGLARCAASGPWPDDWDTLRLTDPAPFAVETARWLS